MKTFKVELARWQTQASQDIEIDWPKVHRTIGVDQCSWLLAQPAHTCQIMLEQLPSHCALIAEFYDSYSWSTYNLMWAK